MDAKTSAYFRKTRSVSGERQLGTKETCGQGMGLRQTRSASSLKKIESLKAKVKQEISEEKGERKHVKNTKKTALSTSFKVETKALQPWVPENWETVLDNIRTMRAEKNAPVDVMGAEQSANRSCSPEERRFHILVSLMLSSQTKDQVNFAAMERLKNHGLTLDNILNMKEDVLANLIYPVGFWRRKASYIQRTASILKEKYNGDIPKTVPELCQLPGVGQKMAVLCVNIAWENVVGIGVDTHVHRIANRLGWTRPPGTKTPEATQKELEDWLPPHLWGEVNVLLVGFGQQICTPLRPQCGTCLNRDICPVGKTWSPGSKK